MNLKIKNVIKVKTIRLDDYIIKHKINHIDMMKIDAQGSDLDVLKSLGNLINIVSNIKV